jgi:hypothetical protein
MMGREQRRINSSFHEHSHENCKPLLLTRFAAYVQEECFLLLVTNQENVRSFLFFRCYLFSPLMITTAFNT